MKKIILHIGYNKTGTTAIQSIFFYNHKKMEKDGLFYPQKCRGKRRSPAHHSLAESLLYQIGKPLPRFVKIKIYSKFPKYHYWQLLHDELAETDCETIFISSEAFSRLRGHPEQMQFIRDQLKDYHIKILVYLRSQPGFLASAYNQAVKRGHETRTVEELLQSGWMTIDYFTELEDWASVFGAENIIVRIFDPQKMPGGVMADVVGVLENEGIRLDTSIRTSKFFSFKWNIRLPNNMVETKRRINAAYRLPGIADRAVNTWLQWRGKHLPNIELLTKAQQNKIIQRYLLSNQKLGQKYLNGNLPFME